MVAAEKPSQLPPNSIFRPVSNLGITSRPRNGSEIGHDRRMEKNNSQEIERATRWVKQKVSEIGYGEIGINLVIHQGEICKTEYKIIEKKIALDSTAKPSPPRAMQEEGTPIQNPKPTKDVELIRVDSVAKMLGVHPVSVRRWVSQGKIPHIKIGSAIRFDRDKIVDHFLNMQR